MNKRTTAATLLILFLVSMFSISLFAQEEDKELEKAWSVVKPDPSYIPQPLPNYDYIPAPQLTRYIPVNNGVAAVSPNFRPFPGTNTTQSEMSVDIHPTNSDIILGSANATNWPFSVIYGTGMYYTTDGGATWGGFNDPPFGRNSGDPANVIGTNGYWYGGFIDASPNTYGQGIARSTDNGATWTKYVVAPSPGGSNILDKNHLMVDKKPGSPFENRVYAAWTAFITGSPNNNKIVLRYSTDFGQTWSADKNLSSAIAAGNHDQGVNIQTGPNGEVYVTWAVYDNWAAGVYGEDAIGFTKSTDGGVTWSTPQRIYSAANFGIRNASMAPKNIRVSSFPSMAVDRSGGPNNGSIYIFWPQKGVAPAGTSPDIVMIKSTDGGTTWTTPVRVNDDPIGNGKDQYYCWATVDQGTGQVYSVFYDSRNTANDSAEVYVARSIDGGNTFENILVSDSRFRPKSISGLASGYQGDYIGIAGLNNKIYPFWADDRTGNYQGWMTALNFGPSMVHDSLPNTENLAGPYPVNVEINSAVPLVPGKLWVHYGRNGSFTDSVQLVNSGGNNYTANIPGNGIAATYQYYVYAEDNTGGFSTYPAGAPNNFFSFVAGPDNEAPVVTHTALQDMYRELWPAVVFANVTDNIGVDTVYVQFKKNFSGSVMQFGLTGSSNGFSGSFNIDTTQLALGDSIYYRIVAKDASVAGNLGYHPSSSAWHTFKFIPDSDFPVVVHQPLRDQAKIKWPAVVKATISDNLGVNNAVVEYSKNNGAITGQFNLSNSSGDLWIGSFDLDTSQVAAGDSIQYRIKATDGSTSANVTYHPGTGYHSFSVIDAKGIVLVVDDDITLEGRVSYDKPGAPDYSSPLGRSASIFYTTLIDAGYVVDTTTFAALDTTVLPGYDLVILSAGIRISSIFNDVNKRRAIVNYTLAGGQTWVEGGEVGYIFRWSSATTDLDPYFRRNVLHDSSWLSDVASGTLMAKVPAHPIFNEPNVLPAQFPITNAPSSSYAARDAMRTILNKPGVMKLATWVGTYQDSAGIIVYYENGGDFLRNAFFTFALTQFTDQTLAAQLIENTADLFTAARGFVPVELVSFSASVTGNNVNLTWATATEINNAGFNVERKESGGNFESVAYLPGRGTTTELSAYAYMDKEVKEGSYTYRLKQTDYDGTVSYSAEVYVDVVAPIVFALEQNYPNPFNPATVIKYSIPTDAAVQLVVYNLLGEKVATLVNENMKAGKYEVNFNASQLASGIYFYRIDAGNYSSVKKMMLLK